MMDVATLTLSLSKKNVRSTLYCALQSNMFNKQNLDSDATLRKRGSGRFFQAVHTTLFKRFSTHASPDAEEHITEDIKPSDYSAEKKELYQNTSGKIAHRGSYSPLDFVSIAGSESAGSIYGEAWPVLEPSSTDLGHRCFDELDIADPREVDESKELRRFLLLQISLHEEEIKNRVTQIDELKIQIQRLDRAAHYLDDMIDPLTGTKRRDVAVQCGKVSAGMTSRYRSSI